MSTTIKDTFSCGLRGFHEYKKIWKPKEGDSLRFVHDKENAFDRHAIAAKRPCPGRIGPVVVGHLPKEISRVTRYIMEHGAIVSAIVTDSHHRRSPLVQGGLEIPIKVTVEMPPEEQNRKALLKYEELITEKYQEPVNGAFGDITKDILCELEEDSDSEGSDQEIPNGED